MAKASTAVGRMLADVPCRVALIAAVGWALCYGVLTALCQGSASASMFVGDVLYLPPIAAGAVAAAVAAHRLAGRQRHLWLLLSVAYSAQLLGECLWAGYDYLTPEGPPDPSFADLCYLIASVVTVVAMAMAFGGAGRMRHVRGLLDTLLIVVSATVLVWQIFIRPQLSEELGWSQLFTVAYPVLDIVLICSLSIVGVAGHRGVPLSIRLVGLAGGLNAISDMFYTYLLVFSDYTSGSWVDVAFETSATCSFLAAVVAIRLHEPTPERRAFDRDFTVLPALAATSASFVLVLVERVTSGGTSVLTLATVGVLFLTVLTRQYLFVADRAALAADLRRAVTAQQRLAVTDGLTGIFNRRHLTERMGLVERSGSVQPVSLLVIDLDHFKRINDTHGHPAGDAVLRESAARIAAACRPDDVVARYGGEEFVVLCPDTDQPAALVLAEQIRWRLCGSPITHDDTEIRVSASIGVATRAAGAAAALMSAADHALYRAKATGRNRVVTDDADPVRLTA